MTKADATTTGNRRDRTKGGIKEMKRIERLIHGLEDCGFTREEAIMLVETMRHHMLREVTIKKMMEKVQRTQ